MIKARLIKRLNRFVALVELDGDTVKAHVANSGRLTELLRPGCEVYLEDKSGRHRATRYDLSLVNYSGRLVSVDARLPNLVVAEAINRGELPELAGYSVKKREVQLGHSRLDMVLENSLGHLFYIEVKSVTLVQQGTARFPDAPTERGSRHIGELAAAVRDGHRGAVIFLIQRDDAEAFTPNVDTDPAFDRALREAAAAGVEVYAYKCKISLSGITIDDSVTVLI